MTRRRNATLASDPDRLSRFEKESARRRPARRHPSKPTPGSAEHRRALAGAALLVAVLAVVGAPLDNLINLLNEKGSKS